MQAETARIPSSGVRLRYCGCKRLRDWKPVARLKACPTQKAPVARLKACPTQKAPVAPLKGCPTREGRRAPLQGCLVDPVFGEVVAERALADAHQLRGVFLDATSLLERAPDRFTLDPLEILMQAHRRQAR